jgi:hypothetical protein
MNSRIWSAACAAIALAATVTVLAQSQPSSQSSESKSTSAKTITVTGCVQRSQASPTGTSGASETTAGAAEAKQTKFVLTNASLSSKEAAGTSGTAAPSATEIASEYRLDTDEATLTPHVGHKVEITGTVEQPKGAEQKPPASAANAPKLKVDNVKMVSETCP